MKEMFYINDLHIDVQLSNTDLKVSDFVENLTSKIPYESILIFGGDYANDFNTLKDFLFYISKKSSEVYLVLGNHDFYVDNDLDNKNFKKSSYIKYQNIKNEIKKYSNITLLESFEIHLMSNGLTIGGDTFWYSLEDDFKYKDDSRTDLMDYSCIQDYDIQYNHFEGLYHFNKLSQNLDILVTHIPPITTESNLKLGEYGFLNRVDKLKSKIHLFGHVHEQKEYMFEKTNLITHAYKKNTSMLNIKL